MNFLFCDINGTINGSDDNREQAIERLADNLNELCAALQINQLYFSFVSTEKIETVLAYVKELEPYLINTSIVLANQYSEKMRYSNGQIEQIKQDTKVTQIIKEVENKEVDRIIFADDVVLYHSTLKHYFSKIRPEIEIVSIIPTTEDSYANAYCSNKYGIDGLNESMEDYIHTLHDSYRR